MSEQKYIVALDQGTTSCRSILVDSSGQIVGMTQKEFPQIFPRPGWVEHDPMVIWELQYATFESLLRKFEISPNQIAGIGITNQRETTVIWNKNTGRPIYNAIVWQDRRTADICEKMIIDGLRTNGRSKNRTRYRCIFFCY